MVSGDLRNPKRRSRVLSLDGFYLDSGISLSASMFHISINTNNFWHSAFDATHPQTLPHSSDMPVLFRQSQIGFLDVQRSTSCGIRSVMALKLYPASRSADVFQNDNTMPIAVTPIKTSEAITTALLSRRSSMKPIS